MKHSINTHHVHSENKDNTKSQNGGHNAPKTNNVIIGIVAIVSILLIVWLTADRIHSNNIAQANNNYAGQATQVLLNANNNANGASTTVPTCKIIVGKTTVYDDTNLAISLDSSGSTYYAGHTIAVKDINANGCVVSVDKESDYLAVGQIQQIGFVYITVKDVLN